jgi:hypothetical protein
MQSSVYSRHAARRSGRWVASVAIAATLVAGLPTAAYATPEASSWSSTFPPSAVERRVGRTSGPVVVVPAAPKRSEGRTDRPAGKRSKTLSAAADAVASALQHSGTTVTQVDPVETSDDALVARDHAKASGVSTVVIVRVFDDDTEAVEAVVTVYDAQGEVLDAFTAKPGRPIAATGSATAGIGAEAAEAALDATDEAEAEHDDAQSAYDQDFVGFEDVYYAQATGSTVVVGKSIQPYRGAYKEPLTGARFYRHIGRGDLADQYKRRRGARIGLIAGGTVAMVAGVGAGMGIMLRGIGDTDDCFDIDDTFARDMCESDADARQGRNLRNGGIVMGALGGVGLVAMFAGFFIKPHPVDASEARRLADEYNTGLRKRVGLAPDAGGDRAQRPSVDVRPTAGRTGAGLVVQGRF